ncbi:unnamed protein product [marine sediment metagenome]|uniref:Uncharacterized protein n=1 Tax=marine sediment metagenome TaxID=412755 RepID=X0Z2E4_9ZZZZ
MTNIKSFWNNEELERDEFQFLPLDNIGTPTFFKVKDWENIKELTFLNKQGQEFSRFYLHTSEGLLPVSSKRLMRQLKPFADKKEKRELTIQRWCEGSDTRSTIFKVELHKVLTSTKLPKTK